MKKTVISSDTAPPSSGLVSAVLRTFSGPGAALQADYTCLANRARQKELAGEFEDAAALWLTAKVLARRVENRLWAEGRHLHCAYMTHLLAEADEYGARRLPRCCRTEMNEPGKTQGRRHDKKNS